MMKQHILPTSTGMGRRGSMSLQIAWVTLAVIAVLAAILTVLAVAHGLVMHHVLADGQSWT